jgi:hypothetical protein
MAHRSKPGFARAARSFILVDLITFPRNQTNKGLQRCRPLSFLCRSRLQTAIGKGRSIKLPIGRVVLSAAISAGFSAALARADDLKPFPSAETGMQRVVVRVPTVPTPDERRVEVLVGKTLEVDCNRQMVSARVTRKVRNAGGGSVQEGKVE